MRNFLFVLALASLLLVALGGATASATTTHPLIEEITVAGTGVVQPEAIDGNGDIIAWLEGDQAVAKYDQNGNPINFTGLGTNVIDGEGGVECPTVPSDCDRVSAAGFYPEAPNFWSHFTRTVAVDNSGGPADGYIYVANNRDEVTCQCQSVGEVDVFNSAGVFLGKIDQSQTFPDVTPRESSTIWVDSAGVLYIDHWEFSGFSHVDRYVPVDANPAHDQFSGQLRTEYGSYEGIAAGPNYAYTLGFDGQHNNQYEVQPNAARYAQSEFHRQGLYNFSVSATFPPDIGPFGGPFELAEPSVIYVDRPDEHVFVGPFRGGGLREFDPENHQIGPTFAEGRSVRGMAVDRSGDAHEGRIFIAGNTSHKIAVFSPPAVIPNIEDVEADTAHSTAHLSARIGLAGGPAPASECTLEYSTEVDVFGNYEHSLPCSPGGSYSTDTTVSADLSGLTIEGEYHYRFRVKNANGRNTSSDHVFQTHAVLDVSTEPVTNLARTQADLNGSLDPDGIPTTYRFEYGISTHYSNKTAVASAGAGTGPEALAPETISGLQPGRLYHYRLTATNALGKTKGPDRTFIVPNKPKISGVHTTGMTGTAADLNARIDSLSYDTTYHFEYGLTSEYGTSTPEEALPSGSEPEAVSAHIAGLSPGFTYHFRVVATNEWGTRYSSDSNFSFEAPQCPNSHVRQQTNASFLPDCRAYELVSPERAGGVTLYPGEVLFGKGAITVLPFGEYYGFSAPNPSGKASSPTRFGFIGAEGNVLGLHPTNYGFDRYVSTRTDTGWVTTYPGRKGDEAPVAMYPSCSNSMDKCIDYRPNSELNVFQEVYVGSNAPYVWDTNGNSLGRWPTNLGAIEGGEEFIGDKRPSPDFSHFVFSSRNIPFAPGGLEAAPGSAYDNDIADSDVSLISKLPSGEPIPQDGGLPSEYITIPAVSTDGSHILMETVSQNGLKHLYMRVDDAMTYEIGEGTLVGMTADGSKVVFTTTDHLDSKDTDNSLDLYVWSEATGESEVISQGNGNGDSDECSDSFSEACGIALVTTKRPDVDNSMGSGTGAIYFYSPEQLDPDNPGVFNERNLYVYRNGHVEYVTTFDPETEIDRMQVSPNGDHMAFLSRTQATSYVSVSPDDGGGSDSGEPQSWEEMYTFDASDGEVLCASCIPSGQPPAIAVAETAFEKQGFSNKDVRASESGRFMSDDGRVAFATADALVPADTNGKLDVYEFVGNRPQLISTGTSERDTQGGNILYPGVNIGLESFSADGRDLYFSTFETLVAQDENGSFVKFYDARTNGGFPTPSELLPCAAADECHGDSTSAPERPSYGTSADLGEAGNVPVAPRKHKKSGKRTKRKRHRHHVHRNHRGGH